MAPRSNEKGFVISEFYFFLKKKKSWHRLPRSIIGYKILDLTVAFPPSLVQLSNVGPGLDIMTDGAYVLGNQDWSNVTFRMKKWKNLESPL